MALVANKSDLGPKREVETEVSATSSLLFLFVFFYFPVSKRLSPRRLCNESTNPNLFVFRVGFWLICDRLIISLPLFFFLIYLFNDHRKGSNMPKRTGCSSLRHQQRLQKILTSSFMK